MSGEWMKGRGWMIGLLLIMAIVCSSALALVDIITAPVIAKNAEIKYKSTVLDVFGITFDPLNPDGILATYDERVEDSEKEGLKFFREVQSGAVAVSIMGSGFQGAISLVIALDGDTITGFKVDSQVETPGLGARITEDGFQKSFIGKKVANGIKMTKSGSPGESEFDAITGATETSRALEKIMNIGFENYFKAVGN